jgi:hypothetical protein
VRRGQVTGSAGCDWRRVAIQAGRVNAGNAGRAASGRRARHVWVACSKGSGARAGRGCAVRGHEERGTRGIKVIRRVRAGAGPDAARLVLDEGCPAWSWGPCQLILATSDPAPAPPNALRLDASMSLKKQRRQSHAAPALCCTARHCTTSTLDAPWPWPIPPTDLLSQCAPAVTSRVPPGRICNPGVDDSSQTYHPPLRPRAGPSCSVGRCLQLSSLCS